MSETADSSVGQDGDSQAAVEIAPVAKNSVRVAGWTLISRITGLVRVVVLAAVLGPTFFGNIVQTTNLLPYFVYNLLAGSMLTSLLVPPMVEALDRGDRKAAERLAGGFLGAILAAGTAAGIVVMLAGPILSRPIVASVPSSDREAAVWLARIMLFIVVPQVLFLAVAGVGVAAQNSRGRFALAAAASIVENVGIIATLLVSALVFGAGIEVGEVSRGHVFFLAIGLTGSVALHAGLQWFGAYRAGVVIRPRLGWADREVRAVLRLVPATIGSTGMTAARYLSISLVAGSVPGAVSAVQVALSFYNLPVALGSFPISTALLPHMSRAAQRKDSRWFIASYDIGLQLAWISAAPASVALVVLAGPVAAALALGAMSTPEAVNLIAVALGAVAFAVVGESSLEVSRRASYANHDAKAPFLANLIRTAMTAIGLWLAWSLDGLATVAAIGLTVTAGDLASAWWLDRAVRRSVGIQPMRPPIARLGHDMVVSLVMALPVFLVSRLFTYVLDPPLGPMLGVAAASIVGLAIYVGVHHRRQSFEVSIFAELLRPKKRVTTDGDVDDGTKSVDPTGATSPLYRPKPVSPDSDDLSDVVIVAAAAIAAVGAGYVATIMPVAGLAVLVGLAFFTAVAFRPELAAYSYIATLPFLAGVERGQYVPFLRLTEASQIVLTAALSLRFVLALLDGAPIPRIRLGKLDKAFVGFAVFASVVPLMWLLVRGLPVTLDDVLSTVPIWKYYGLYLLMRASVKEVHQVRVCLYISITVAAVTGLVATFQALNLFGAPNLLATFWAPPGTEAEELVDGRGSGFLGSSIATASYVTYNAGIAVGLAWTDGRRRLWPIAIALVLTVSTFGIGQITGILSLAIVVFLVATLSGRLRHLNRLAMVVIPAALILVWPVVNNRINETESSTGLPQSWVVRWDNLTTFYWPEFRGYNWILGVRPDSIIAAPETWREDIFLESGYTWLLWVGGLPLLITFLYFARTLLSQLYGVIELRADAVGIAALSAFAAFFTIAVLALIDMHITTRGEADITYVLVALAMTAAPITLTRRQYRENLARPGQLAPRSHSQAGGRGP